MRPRALVIDDKADIAEAVADFLASLGHDHDYACCQEEARARIAAQRYDYILLDLEIPVQASRGLPRIQNGENLLDEIIASPLQKAVPVIVMSGHGTDSPSLAVQMMKRGAADFVTKPFPTSGNTLDKAIREALEQAAEKPTPSAGPPAAARLEESPAAIPNEIIFEKERILLWGVRICDGLLSNNERMIFDVLRVRGALGGGALAKAIGCESGENTVSKAVGRIRKRLSVLFPEPSRWPCPPEEVILSGGRGFRINETIQIIDRTDGAKYALVDAAASHIRGGADRR